MRHVPKLTRVEVVWRDACSHSGWFDPPQADEELVPYMVTSSGYVVRDDADGLAIAQSITSVGKFGDILFVPRGMVQKVTRG